jgi:GAF domain-containing protein
LCSNVPICLISLITEDRQCFKSSVGLPEELLMAGGTEREAAFCQYVVTDQQPMVVENPHSDPRFKDNRLVRDFHLKFYAGVPLVTKEGYVLGSLCIIDFKPRTFTKNELDLLTDFSHWVMTEFELREELQVRKKTEQELEELLERSSG